jgi:serine protease
MPITLSPLPAVLAVVAAATLALSAAPAQATVTATRAAPQREFRPGEVVVRTADGPQVRRTRAGESVLAAVRRFERQGLDAHPNYVARISAYTPNDPGRADGGPGGWLGVQWNLSPEVGINAQAAWENTILAGRPGGKGVVVAVLDTGVAYLDRGKFRRSPDLPRTTFVRGYDFVDGDPYPSDHNGHGTHVASTIAEAADNGIGLVGIAYGARIMPVRVLDRLGEGDSVAIARGIRHAARHGADIINLSFEFSSSVTAAEIPEILSALRYARKKNVLVVGASGNMSSRSVAYPARAQDVLSVGATTEHGCVAEYSNNGSGLDIAAPGGGPDAAIESEPDHCRPFETPGRDIFQMTFTSSVRTFGIPSGYMGTSMAAPHVSATAALIIASGAIGAKPTATAIERRLETTAKDLGAPGPDSRYGWGLIDAGAATAPPPARNR